MKIMDEVQAKMQFSLLTFCRTDIIFESYKNYLGTKT